MSTKLFSGISKKGDFEDALRNAIANAKETLQTDYIEWELDSTQGEYGGFTLQEHLTVIVRVKETTQSTKIFKSSNLQDNACKVISLNNQHINSFVPSVVPVNSDAKSTNKETPEESCRRLLQKILPAGEKLPDTKSIELYHIRCLSYIEPNSKATGVYFVPEFLYLLDVGFPNLAGVSIMSPRIGAGDPNFPDFSNASFRSVKSNDPKDLIYPELAGQIFIGTHSEIESDTLEKLLASFATNIEGNGTSFSANCNVFREQGICKEIEKSVEVVRYAIPIGIVRIIDILPGWFVDRVL